MTRSAGGVVVAVITAGIWYAALRMRLRPDPFGMALAPFAIVVGLTVIIAMLTLAWACDRWLLKRRRVASVFAAAIVSFGAFASGARILESRWFADGFLFFGFHALVLFVPTLIWLLLVSMKQKAEPGAPGQRP